MKTNIYGIRLLILFCAILTLTACPKKRSSPAATQVKTVIMGDPLKVIEGATLDSKIDFAFFSGLQTIKLKAMLEFAEKQQLKLGAAVSQQTLEKENAATSTGKKESFIEMNVKHSTGPDFAPQVSLYAPKFSLDLSNRLVDGKRIVVARAGSASQTAELLHFSVSEDQQEMSLLIRSNDADSGTTITAIYFTKRTSGEAPVMLDKKYYYINGPGVKAAWPKGRPIEFYSCGANSREIFDVIGDSVNKWNSALSGLHSIALRQATGGCAPFSDLKQHGVYYIDSFRVEPNDSIGSFGVAATVTFNSSILDSDILIFKSELLKEPYRRNAKLHRTVLHEMGHFLGLDHQFDGSPSIMSYDFSDGSVITPYDQAAIQELYK